MWLAVSFMWFAVSTLVAAGAILVVSADIVEEESFVVVVSEPLLQAVSEAAIAITPNTFFILL
jgi:hypothetical protein